MSDLYEVLQVRRGADPEVIRAAYRALARKNHPDFGGKPERMALINEAWAVLGNPARRAAYDATPQSAVPDRPGTATYASATSAPDSQPAGRPGHGLSGRRPEPSQSGSVLDFGRYSGWTVASLVNHDPDYLEWLARTPIGRRLSNEIDQALARSTAEMASRQPSPKPAHRRSFGRPWTASHSTR
jgi:curved DNA-binding protein CbpA